jgi:PAS domain-containing protein
LPRTLHIILDGLQEGEIALEADNTLIYHNQAACQLFGVANNEELARAIAPVLPLCELARQGAGSQSIPGRGREEATDAGFALAGDQREARVRLS